MMRPSNGCFIILIVVSKSFLSKERKFTFWNRFICTFNAIDRVRFFFFLCCICIDLLIYSVQFNKHKKQLSTKPQQKRHILIQLINSFIIFCRIEVCFSFNRIEENVYEYIIIPFIHHLNKKIRRMPRVEYITSKESLLIAEWKYYNLNVDSSFTCIINRCFTCENYFQWI